MKHSLPGRGGSGAGAGGVSDFLPFFFLFALFLSSVQLFYVSLCVYMFCLPNLSDLCYLSCQWHTREEEEEEE